MIVKNSHKILQILHDETGRFKCKGEVMLRIPGYPIDTVFFEIFDTINNKTLHIKKSHKQ